MYIIGSHIKTIFYNSNNNFTVGLIKILETDFECSEKQIIWTGFALPINNQTEYKLIGQLTTHPKYGLQFSATELQKLTPNTEAKLKQYFASDLFPGIGEVIAEKIVTHLGDNAINIILENPKVLDKIEIAAKKRQIIIDVLQKNMASNKIITDLMNYDFSLKEDLQIYNHFQDKSATLITENIYDIYFNLPEIGFLKIDNIALANNYQSDNQKRISALIVYLIKEYVYKSGDAFIEKEKLLNLLKNQLLNEYNQEIIAGCLQDLVINLQIIIEQENIYLFEFYDAETYITNFLKNKETKVIIDSYLELAEKQNKITYNKEQKQAIVNALNNKISLITGGPGVGKSTIIEGIITTYQNLYQCDSQKLQNQIAVLAPTGRASKRIRELTNFPAMTIHRFLKWHKEKNVFLVNEYNKSQVKMVIVDEASMIDLLLFANLLKGLDENVRLVIIGDYNQLPPITPGQVFRDLINSSVFPVCRLLEIYRQENDSFIPQLAHYVKDAEIGEWLFADQNDYQFIEGNSNNLLELLKKLIIAKKYKFDEIQIMAPIYRGKNGIDKINQEMQNVFNPPKNQNEIKHQNHIFREGDKVIQLNNLLEKEVYNGDIGVIKQIISNEKTASGKSEILIDFYDKTVKYLPNELHHINLAYCISIHKSQGSEFKTVIMPLCASYRYMLYRLLIYTGITRAKEKLYLLGEKRVFNQGILNQKEIKRKSLLKERLNNEIISQ